MDRIPYTNGDGRREKFKSLTSLDKWMRSITVALGVDDDDTKLSEEHFGDSRYYLIYEVREDGTYKLIEKRLNRVREMEEREHGDPRKFKAIDSLLEDVDVFLAGRMGPNFLRVSKSRHYPMVVGRKTVKEALSLLRRKLDEVMSEVERRRSMKHQQEPF